MTRIVSGFEEVVTQFSRVLPANADSEQALDRNQPLRRTTMSGSHTESDSQSAQFDGVPRRVSYRRMPFVERRCPICGRFGCGGC